MTSARAIHDSGFGPVHAGQTPSRRALRIGIDGLSRSEASPEGASALLPAVLRALVERFGGEVLTADLARHLSRQMGCPLTILAPGLAETLHRLETLRAVDLDDDAATGPVIRLLPAGAALYL